MRGRGGHILQDVAVARAGDAEPAATVGLQVDFEYAVIADVRRTGVEQVDRLYADAGLGHCEGGAGGFGGEVVDRDDAAALTVRAMREHGRRPVLEDRAVAPGEL